MLSFSYPQALVCTSIVVFFRVLRYKYTPTKSVYIASVKSTVLCLTNLAESMNHSVFAGGAAVASAFRIQKVVLGHDLLGVYVFLSYVK